VSRIPNEPAPTAAQGEVVFPGNLKANPRLSQWLGVRPDGSVTVTPGKVEIGQGILTALAQIAADELDVDLARIRLLPATTGLSPNEGVTSGSLSVQDCGVAVRFVCAEVRHLFLEAAAERLGVPVGQLGVEDGTVTGPGNARTSYWELAGQVSLDRDAGCRVAPKPAGARRLAGAWAPRIDIPDKVFGAPHFIHDMTLPGLLHGRVLRPDAPRAQLVAFDEAAVRASPGVIAVVRDGSFLGVVAETEDAAAAALERLRAVATWAGGEPLPDEHALREWLKSEPAESQVVHERGTPRSGVRTLRRSYARPFIAHGSIAPSCALAQWHAGGVRVWSHCQGIYNLRADLALVLRLDPERIVVRHVEGSRLLRPQRRRRRGPRCRPPRPGRRGPVPCGCSGRGPTSWRARPSGPPCWSRSRPISTGAARSRLAPFPVEQRTRGPAGPQRDPDAARRGRDRGAVPALHRHQSAARGRGRGGPERGAALRLPERDGHEPPPARDAAAHLVPALPRRLRERVRDRVVPGRAGGRARGGSGDFRLRHLSEPRARAVLEAASARAGWRKEPRPAGRGQGVGLARYKNTGAWCAVVADVEVEDEPRVRRLTIAVDVGEVVNPDGVGTRSRAARSRPRAGPSRRRCASIPRGSPATTGTPT
jgi:hypothetical protein